MSFLSVSHLKKLFPIKGGLLQRAVAHVHAVDDISFSVARRETVGLVGESGCGKSTLGRCLLKLVQPTSGQISFKGRDISSIPSKELWEGIQMVFQDPMSSLNPRLTVGYIIGEPLVVRGLGKTEVDERVNRILTEVGLNPEHSRRYPHEFSGGQRQRIMVARALVTSPELIVLDEPTSSLDVSVQAKTLNLLSDLKKSLGVTYLFISHDLSVVKHMSDRILVMYVGRLVEAASKSELFENTLHPYTQLLLSSIPLPRWRAGESKFRTISDIELPSNINVPKGCRFQPRCPRAMSVCSEAEPEMVEVSPGHFVACHVYNR